MVRRLLLTLLGLLVVSGPTVGGTPPAAEVVVTYFHRTYRCATCLLLEDLARTTVTDDLATDLASGVLAWHSVNLDEEGNAHYVQDYDLDGPSLVVTEYGEAGLLRWRNLDRIWELSGEPDDYADYVSTAVRAYLDGEPDAAAED